MFNPKEILRYEKPNARAIRKMKQAKEEKQLMIPFIC